MSDAHPQPRVSRVCPSQIAEHALRSGRGASSSRSWVSKKLARALIAPTFVAGLAACSGAPPQGTIGPSPAIAPEGTPAPSNLKIVTTPSKPRLALLTRDGDPAPAMVAVVATDLGSAPTVALAAIVEARLTAAGLPIDARVDRGSFRVRLLATSQATSPKAFFQAVSDAMRAPIAAGSPEVVRATQNVGALRRNPLPAAEAAPIADCTGRLGLAPKEKALELSNADGVAELEKDRQLALTTARTALAVVGPATLCVDAERALSETSGWLEGAPIPETWPASDRVGAYPSNDVAKGRARITVALRVGDAPQAVSAAERLGEARGGLRSRLGALPYPFRVTEVIGVAHPRGGCVAITAEADQSLGPQAATISALAAAIARKEIAAEAHTPADPAIATKAILAATDPRDAASRAAWWMLTGPTVSAPDRWATALALPPDDRGDLSAATKRFDAELATAIAASDAKVVERRSQVERGQGEVWVLLASPCGATDEGPYDAGSSALAALAVTDRERRGESVTIEPWITPEGIGVIAHATASALDGVTPRPVPQAASPTSRATSLEMALAQRVSAVAARAIAGHVPSREATADARATAIAQMERSWGPNGAALESLLNAIAPDHPAQLSPFGPFSRLAALPATSVSARWQWLASGPLRMAVLANTDPAQVEASFAEADHWLAPRPSTHPCPATPDSSIRPGHYEVDLPPGAELSQALVAAPVAGRGQPGRDQAEIAAQLLGGDRGLAQAALDQANVPASASARLVGGARVAAIVIEVRAPSAALDDAVGAVKAQLVKLGQDGPPDDLLQLAHTKLQRADRDAAFDPRSRLVKLWTGDTSRAAPQPPPRAAMASFFTTAFREAALTVVEARRR